MEITAAPAPKICWALLGKGDVFGSRSMKNAKNHVTGSAADSMFADDGNASIFNAIKTMRNVNDMRNRPIL